MDTFNHLPDASTRYPNQPTWPAAISASVIAARPIPAIADAFSHGASMSGVAPQVGRTERSISSLRNQRHKAPKPRAVPRWVAGTYASKSQTSPVHTDQRLIVAPNFGRSRRDISPVVLMSSLSAHDPQQSCCSSARPVCLVGRVGSTEYIYLHVRAAVAGSILAHCHCCRIRPSAPMKGSSADATADP